MKLTLAEPKFLKEPVNVISELVNEVRFKFDKNKMELIAMDPANVAMVMFKLLSSAFVDYDVKEDTEIAVNLDSLKQILKRAKPSDTLVIELDKDRNRLKIQLKGESNRTFNLGLIDIEDREQKIPELSFNAKIEMPTIVFDEAVEDMDVISDSISLMADAKRFTIQAEGHISDGKVEVLNEEDVAISLTGTNVKAKYSSEYLKKIIKGSKLVDKVVIQFSNDYPLRIDYILKDRLQLSTILAPRTENV